MSLNLFNIDQCSEEELDEKIKEIYQNFKKDVERALDDLSWKIFGNFFLTVGLLVSKLAAGAVANVMSFATSMLLSNIIGGITALIGLALSLFNGAQIMLMYLGAVRHSINLRDRQRLTSSMLIEIGWIIQVLQSLKALDDDDGMHLLRGVEAALPHVKNAHRLVGVEQSRLSSQYTMRISSDANSVNNRNILAAQESVSAAMRHLTGDNTVSPLLRNYILQLNDKYQIATSYEIDGELFTVSLPLGTSGLLGYFTDVTRIFIQFEDPDLLRQFVLDFIASPGINRFIRTYAASRFLNAHLDSIGRRFPITSVALKQAVSNVLSSKINTPGAVNKFKDALDDVFDYLDLQRISPDVEYPTDNATLRGLSMGVRISQAALLMVEDWFKIVQFEAGALRAFLTPAERRLRSIKGEMQGALANPGEISRFQIGVDKIGWIGELAFVRSLLGASTESPLSFNGSAPMDASEINREFAYALNLFEALQNSILNRTIDEDGNERKQPGAEALEIANAQLNSLVLGTASIFSRTNRAHILSQLQAIRVLLSAQQQEDFIEQRYAEEFIREVERNPIFRNVLKPAWDTMMSQLSDIGGRIVGDLDKGDLSTFVNALSNAAYAQSKLRQLNNCSDEEQAEEDAVTSLIEASGDPEAEETIREVNETITYLKNYQTKLDELVKLSAR